MKTFRLNIFAYIWMYVSVFKTHDQQQGGILLNQSTTVQAEEGSSVSSYFTDEKLSEKWCL